MYPETDKGPSREELAAESSLLIAAGSDTSAVAVSGAIFYFLYYLECLRKAITEARSTFNSIEDIRGSNMVNLTVNLMVEVLKGGLTVDGNYFPQGTTLGVAPYVIHHNMQYYPDPYAFCPERWSSTDKYCSVVTDDEKSTPESVVRASHLVMDLEFRRCYSNSTFVSPRTKGFESPVEREILTINTLDDEGTMSISLSIAFCPSRMGPWSNSGRGRSPINDD
ncbi:hypothetical protein MferCBS31731_001423 [Microsporum ferrugineum]